jgi:hypothetical protein
MIKNGMDGITGKKTPIIPKATKKKPAPINRVRLK